MAAPCLTYAERICNTRMPVSRWLPSTLMRSDHVVAPCFPVVVGISCTPAPSGPGSVQETAKLPRVLILGDSISIGYTEPVRKQLQGKAEVLRPNANCQAYRLRSREYLEGWSARKSGCDPTQLGIWDTHMLDAQNRLER